MAMQGGFGVELQIDVTGLTAIVHVLDSEFPELEKVLADMTGHDATGGWDEQVATGLFQSGEFKATIGWDAAAATHIAVQAAFDSLSPVSMAIVNPDTTETLSFSAFISKMGRISAQDDGYKAEVTIKPTGAITIT